MIENFKNVQTQEYFEAIQGEYNYLELNEKARNAEFEVNKIGKIIFPKVNKWQNTSKKLRETTIGGLASTCKQSELSVCKIIHPLFQFFSKSYANEIVKQDAADLMCGLETFLKDQSKYDEVSGKMQGAKREAEDYRSSHPIAEVNSIINNPENTLLIMKMACGGEDKWEAIPVIDPKIISIENCFSPSGVKPAQMSASIMRFPKECKAEGILVRTDKGIQCFYQYLNARWVSGGACAIPFNPRTRIRQIDFEILKKLLTEGQVTFKENEAFLMHKAGKAQLV